MDRSYCILIFCSLVLLSKAKIELGVVSQFVPEICVEKAEDGDAVSVHYTGSLTSGVIFDSSLADGREPITFTLGEKRVIAGWEQGIKGMCVGEKRKLNIPSELGYGKQGYPPVIPGGATLIFETELVKLEKRATPDKVMPFIRFWSVPAIILVILYSVYRKAFAGDRSTEAGVGVGKSRVSSARTAKSAKSK